MRRATHECRSLLGAPPAALKSRSGPNAGWPQQQPGQRANVPGMSEVLIKPQSDCPQLSLLVVVVSVGLHYV